MMQELNFIFSLSAKSFPNSNLTNETDDSLHVSNVQEPNR